MAGYGQLLLLPVMLGLLYFLTIRPNQAKQKKWQEMLGQLKSGDKVDDKRRYARDGFVG